MSSSSSSKGKAPTKSKFSTPLRGGIIIYNLAHLIDDEIDILTER